MTVLRFSILFLVAIAGFAGQSGLAQSPSFRPFMNPVFPGDRPDPTLTKIGNDFYASGSSFSPTPVIYHSTDLVHWEAIAQPVSASWSFYGAGTTDGVWGGQLVFHEGKYWHFFGHWGTIYFVTSGNVQGPWSSPVAMNCPASVPGLGMDNSIFVDDDDSWYMLVKNGQENNWILQLGANGQPAGKILDLRWINPSPAFPFGWAEGPVMWKRKGVYYYSFAINAAGGQKVFSSQTLISDKSAWTNLGDFFDETDPKKSTSLFQGANHASQVIMLEDSTSWVIFQSYLTANSEWEGQGRQGLLSQVFYDTTGKPTANYPTNYAHYSPVLPSSGIPWMVPHSDFFDSTKLSPEWSLLGYSPTSPWSLTARPGWLRLSPKNAQNTVIKNDAEHNYSLITKLDFSPKTTADEAGIRIMTGLQNLFAKLYCSVNSSGNKIIVFSFATTSFETANDVGNVVWLRLVRENHILTASYSNDGFSWKAAGSSINVKSMDVQQANFNAWTGNKQGLYVKGSTSADFDLYIYRDAYTPVLAEFPANQWGTVPAQGFLNQINNNDWALYAGIEFRNDSSLNDSFSFECIASSILNSGIIELWLDSIDTGEKIGDCIITSTGSIVTFKTFKTNILPVHGTHDVYLRFKGASTSKFMLLESFRFISPYEVKTAINENHINELKIYPNPASNGFTISTANYAIDKVEIYDTNGKLMQSETCTIPVNSHYFLKTKLAVGVYILKVKAGNYTDSQKIVIER